MKNSKFLFLLPLILISGCNSSTGNDKTLSIASFNYENNQNTVVLSEEFNAFSLYKRNKDTEYTFYKTIKENRFSYTGINQDFKIVPLKGGKEIKAKAIEYNYFDHLFQNDGIKVFDDELSSKYIQNIIDNTKEEMMVSEFSNKRHSFMFLKGNYKDIVVKNGYYTSVHGLGKAPLDVVVNRLETRNHPNTSNALINFWRSIENFHVSNDSMWAVSQAAPARRMSFAGGLHLSDYEEGKQNWSSGGFLANSYVANFINNGTQQQYYLRNSKFGSYTHTSFNNVYEGCVGQIPFDGWINNHASIIEKTYDVIEKPNILFDEKLGLGVNIYDKKSNSSSYSWNDLNKEKSTFLPISSFEIINDKTDLSLLNSFIKAGKNLLFTPGIYDIEEPILVNKDNIVIMGLGLATLRCRNNDTIIRVDNVKTNISSLLLQSGTHSDFLMELNGDENVKDTYLGDVFFRAGGEDAEDTFVETCLAVNQSNAIFDNLWIWRADHGNNIGWEKNAANQGIVVNGENNIFHCLMVEHFQKYQTTFNGNGNMVIFYQSETPYDALKQEDWTRGNEEKDYGYASYFVNENVTNHYGIGLGVYFVSIAKIPTYSNNAYEVTKNENVYLKNMVMRHFGGQGGFVHFINDEDGVREGDEDSKNFYYESF